MDENFLLNTKLAQRLYHEHICSLPVIDYHNHLPVKDIAKNRNFGDLTELWIAADPYKHRAMRICGIDEAFITGKASGYDKFAAYSSVLPKLAGNPLYHWSNMELSQVFGIEEPLCADSGKRIWHTANRALEDESYFAQGLLRRFHIEYAAPCCTILEDLGPFGEIDSLYPSLRGDGILPLPTEFVSQLGQNRGGPIRNWEDLKAAFSSRLDEFHQEGCRFADHALDHGFHYIPDDGHNERRFQQLMSREPLNLQDSMALSCEVLRMLGSEYAARGWTMQLHAGAMRYTSSRLRSMTGPAGGYAGIGNCAADDLSGLLNDLEQKGSLPKTILFTLNPSCNEALSVLSGSFVEQGMPGKVQQGCAWWWCDHIKGIRDVLETFSAYSVLSVFYGMTTDSRSLLSFTRHDYFRRILCGWLGEKSERMEMPRDYELLRDIAEDICYRNAKRLLGTALEKGKT